ncbi:probable G-protein coupled receptor No9 [Actinia tenebrosa]|uniref:Probable G-protein coupled receptor No9 n=1 Tax=Actinia tenebrosa TaxID=6105 RepID=A0A6P8HV54_ACTTE|nr:probable G-protein coupled receptor No9 [Actinia tenebrosa]
MVVNNTTLTRCETHIKYDIVSTIAQASFVIFILLLDVCGNCLVCGAILTYRRLRTVTNYFIVSLAVSDLLVAGLSMPFRIHHTLHSMCWDLGISVCEFWIFVDLVCCSASICNLSMVSVDRFLALSHPLTYLSIMTKRRAFIAIALVWAYSVFIAALSFTGPWSPDGSMTSIPACHKKDKYYYTFAITVSFFLPMIILVINYSLVFRVALVQARKLRLLSNHSNFDTAESSEFVSLNGGTRQQDRQSVASIGRIDRRQRKSIVRELKATKTLAIVVGTFIICWVPFFVIMLIVQFCPECVYDKSILNETAQKAIGTVFVYVLPLLNSAVNPIIYSSFNTDFRRAFRDILFRLCMLSRRSGRSDIHVGARSMNDLDLDNATMATVQALNINTTKDYKKLLPNNVYKNGNTPKIVIHEVNSENQDEEMVANE